MILGSRTSRVLLNAALCHLVSLEIISGLGGSFATSNGTTKKGVPRWDALVFNNRLVADWTS